MGEIEVWKAKVRTLEHEHAKREEEVETDVAELKREIVCDI